MPEPQTYNPWLHRLALLTVVATFVLIVVGGLVTSTDSGMAVPDWPTTFGYNMFLYPLSKTVSGFLFSLPPALEADLNRGVLSSGLRAAIEQKGLSLSDEAKVLSGDQLNLWRIHDAPNERTYTVIKAGDRLNIYVPGVLYEHTHRLIGSVVGILTVALTLFIWLQDSRRWLKWLAAIALVSVIVQGVMGGLRVVHISRFLAIVHGCFAQAFFAMVGAIALFTSPRWVNGRTDDAAVPELPRLQRLSLFTASFIYLQLVWGAILRHTGTRLDAHLFFALIVTLHVFLLVRRILRTQLRDRWLAETGGTLALLLGVQLMLGIGAWLIEFTGLGAALSPMVRAAITTGHVGVGALMLLTAVVLTLKAAYLGSGAVEVRVSGKLASGEISA